MDKTIHILVIEDELTDYELIRRLLRSQSDKYQTFHVDSISKSREALATEKFDVVLLDLFLPDSMGGLKTFDEVYSLASEIPIIILSGLEDSEIAIEAVKRGAQDYLNKDEITGPLLSRSITYSIERRLVVGELLQTKKMASIGTLAGGIAHDFNNLLTIILGYADISLSHCGDNKKLQKQLREIKAASNTAKELTQQLLTFSRNKPQKKSISNLNTIIDVMRKSLLRLMSENTQTEFSLREDLWNNEVDTSQIERIILNLCLNAQDAMAPKGGGLITIKTDNVTLTSILEKGITRIPAGHYTRLSVSDEGSGIPADMIENIFEPFFTTKKLGETHHGAGMGLSIVYGAVLRARGYIVVDSVLNQGTTFDIYLPQSLEAQISGNVVPEQIETAPSQTAKILVVEDEDGVRDLVAQILEEEGYDIHVAANPKDALEISRSIDHLDLVLTDLLMPGMNGNELADIILKEKPGTEIIFMSGYTEDAISVNGLVKEDVNLFMKPFTPGQLIQRIHESLSQKQDKNSEDTCCEGAENQGKLKILNVDDNILNAEIINRILASYGNCISVSNGFEAISLFKKACEENNHFDVILLDVMMADINGIETLKKIREYEKDVLGNSRHTKIVLLTAIEESIDNLSLDQDMFYDGYLQKPVDGPTIVEELKRLGLLNCATA